MLIVIPSAPASRIARSRSAISSDEPHTSRRRIWPASMPWSAGGGFAASASRRRRSPASSSSATTIPAWAVFTMDAGSRPSASQWARSTSIFRRTIVGSPITLHRSA